MACAHTPSGVGRYVPFPPCVVFRLDLRNVMSPGGNCMRELLGATGRHIFTYRFCGWFYNLKILDPNDTMQSYKVKSASTIDRCSSKGP